MNRRGFLGLLGKLTTVGAAMGVSPALLKPVEQRMAKWSYEWVEIGPRQKGIHLHNNEGYTQIFEVRMTNEQTGGSLEVWASR